MMLTSQGVSTANFKRLPRKRRRSIADQFDEDDVQALAKYVTERPMHAPFADRMLLLKKLNIQKRNLQVELDQKSQIRTEIRRMSDQIHRRKTSLESMRESLGILPDRIEQKRKQNKEIQVHIDKLRRQIQDITEETRRMTEDVELSQTKLQEKLNDLAQAKQSLQITRQTHLDEVVAYIIPIRRISADEDTLRERIRALRHAEIYVLDESNNIEQMNAERIPTIWDEGGYQVVNSYVPLRDNYRIDTLIEMYTDAVLRDNIDGPINDIKLLQWSLSKDAYETLAALSHSCQLINIIACFLSVELPFRLHQREFHKEELIIDHLRTNIEKLNANIVSVCFSQEIHIEPCNDSYTLENLLKLLRSI